jgi:hypothetical protein
MDHHHSYYYLNYLCENESDIRILKWSTLSWPLKRL